MEVDCWRTRALALALPQRGLEFEREVEIPIAFDAQMTTRRRVGFVISNDDEEPLLETKGRSTMLPEGVEQCLLYLREGYHRVCVPGNLSEKPLGIQRFLRTQQGGL